MTYATIEDVSTSLGRPISGAETDQVQSWLNRVESRMRRRIPSLAALAADADYLETLIGVEVDVVVRRVINPEGKTGERVDDYSYGLSATAVASDLWPNEDEWRELMPARTRTAFTVRPAYGP